MKSKFSTTKKINKLKKASLIALSMLAFGVSSSYACSVISHKYGDNIGELSARSMDFCAPMKSAMKVYPRGLSFMGTSKGVDTNGAKPLNWQNKYGYVAITQPDFGADVSAEGINEQGLGVHILYNGAAKDAGMKITSDKPIVDSFRWLQYVLGNYNSVANIVEDIEQGKYQIYTFPINIGGEQVSLPVHFKVEDRTGNSAIIEFVDGKLNIREGGQYNVMANEPNYDEQVAHLNQIKNAREGKEYNIDVIPGGANSENRFVRANFISEHLPDISSQDAEYNEDGIGYMYGAINSVMVPFTNGYACDFSPEASPEDNWPTQWVSAMNLNKNKLYFSNEHIGNRVWVDLNETNLAEGQPVKSINLDNPNLVGDITSKIS